MRIQGKQAIGENLLYLLVWTVILLVPVLNSQMMSEMHIKFENVLIAWRQIAPYLVIFLIHNAILAPRFMLRHKYWKYLISNLALVIVVFWLVQIYEEHLVGNIPLALALDNDPETPEAYRRVSFSNLEMYWNVLLGFFMTGANTGIKLIYQSMRDEQKMEALKRQNLQAEMDYLKYQINPHFFMNTLNNIHALIDINPDSAKQCVIELSNMMRYVAYDSGGEEISMKKDMEFIDNYIELMRIRYPEDIDIRFEYPRNLSNKVAVPPLIFIVFVENAFKHGISYRQPSYIHISIRYSEGTVTAYFENSVHGEHTGKPVGIGLDNVRKRLELIYGKRYELKIDDSDRNRYCVTLTIPTIKNDNKMLGN